MKNFKRGNGPSNKATDRTTIPSVCQTNQSTNQSTNQLMNPLIDCSIHQSNNVLEKLTFSSDIVSSLNARTNDSSFPLHSSKYMETHCAIKYRRLISRSLK